MQITEVSVFGVRSAVIDLRSPDARLTFRLFPMVHIAKSAFYREVEHRLRVCDLVIAEGVDEPSPHGYAVTLAMRLTFQRSASTLMHQYIDHTATEVPTLWESVLPRSVPAWLVYWFEVLLLTPIYVVLMALGGRDWLLQSGFEISDDTDVSIGFLTKRYLHDRDAALLRMLSVVYDQRRDHPEIVAVVYGAAHMPAVVRGLRERFGYRPVRAEWMTPVWDEASLHRPF
ncbi:hypothetical protein [Nocardia crassostreae]|uniref:hypothetical protein n=1 Tax=Nocardia crassostreae TaxID=53428 RepID=UPI0008296C74|nr:hypothetical protein [Nocardia crassostreae]